MKYPDAPTATVRSSTWAEDTLESTQPFVWAMPEYRGSDEVLRRAGYRRLPDTPDYRFEYLYAKGWLRWVVNATGQRMHRAYWASAARLYKWGLLRLKPGLDEGATFGWWQFRPFPFGRNLGGMP